MKANDYITRHEALRVLQINFGDYCGARRAICKLPAADVAPVVHGRWVPTEAPFMNEYEDCSWCGYRTVWGNEYDYCPNCGAKMDGGTDDGA